MDKIAFIGLGIMGRPMCLNLLKAGYPVTVHNRTPSKADEALQAGAEWAASPKEAAEKSDIIITMVPDTPDVEEVILGDKGVIHGARRDSVVMDMSTISPSMTKEIAHRLRGKNIAMLDAPVSGGDIGAQNGTLAIMAGGEESVFRRCLPVLQILGKTVTLVGTHGMGQTVKLCNQILVAVTNMAVCEALVFGKKSGVDPSVMIEAVKDGAAGSWQLSNLGPKMIQRDYAPGFMIDLQQKDLRLALESAQEINLPLSALNLVRQLYSDCQAHGEGRLGTQALIKSLERLAEDSGD
jgi:2-hydroxy-3-oxopropionate reductase